MKKLIYNAKVYTMDGFRKSLLIEDGIIKKIYNSDPNINDNDIEKINAKGKLVLPGFNDSHLHLFHLGTSLQNIRLYDATSIDEVIEISKNFISRNTPIGLVVAEGYNQDKFVEKRLLTKDDLDKISTDLPLLFRRVCGHIVTVNSKALELANITKDTKVDGGGIGFDQFGNLNGLISENAIELLETLYAPLTIKETKKILKDAINYASSKGITSLQTNDININNYRIIYQAYQELYNEGLLNIRVNHQVTFNNLDDYLEFIKIVENNEYHKIGPLKLFIDGSLGAKTAYMINGYIDEKDNHGILCIEENNLIDLVKRASEIGLTVIIHAIGDYGIKTCLNVFRHVIKGDNNLRHGIVHAQITSKDLLEEIKELGIYIYSQPIFIDYDMSIVNLRVEKSLAKTSYAFKTLYDSTVLSIGTDCPVEDINPMHNIYCAVTRKNILGNNVYNKNEALSLDEAILGYTYKSAFMSFEENVKGLINEGYYADLVILDDDIFDLEVDKIKDVDIYMTLVGGKVTFCKEK